jgi:hypothetical protein
LNKKRKTDDGVRNNPIENESMAFAVVASEFYIYNIIIPLR